MGIKVQQNKQHKIYKYQCCSKKGLPTGFSRRPTWVQCQTWPGCLPPPPPLAAVLCDSGLSGPKCCHTESSMPEAHLHIISLKQKVEEHECRKDAFSSGKQFHLCLFSVQPQSDYKFSRNSWGHVMKWASCWKHMLLSVFYPWLLDSLFPYIPLSFFTLPIPQKPFPSI